MITCIMGPERCNADTGPEDEYKFFLLLPDAQNHNFLFQFTTTACYERNYKVCDGGFGRPSDFQLCSGLGFTRGIEAKFQLYQTGDTSLSCHRDFVFKVKYSTQRILIEN
jgi:hypothetical protein